ncbi:lymphatic vessel endothelial hyaluronic receptor 1b isoform X2 [Denticeps clupeoides]|uniref:lymphatic vessel endothelial hyaluronic receptor 1b isoform X2 n=1 Tax=Denticeps clupeoides TaxID=299321 RepID=UPI0010A2BFE9|nr:lymphatic vessel endothelial hyaluronic acid receptor 1-like isoform X2 [Denticeps clupeoides]
MDRLWTSSCLMLLLLLLPPVATDSGSQATDLKQLQASTQSGIMGVFLASLSKYSFDALTARNVCIALNASIATRTQVQTANAAGMETCRYGWVEENIAVVPRINSNKLCGQGKVGLVSWKANLNIKFDVFCFKADLVKPLNSTTTSIQPGSHPTAKAPPLPISTTFSSRASLASSSTSLLHPPDTSIPPSFVSEAPKLTSTSSAPFLLLTSSPLSTSTPVTATQTLPSSSHSLSAAHAVGPSQAPLVNSAESSPAAKHIAISAAAAFLLVLAASVAVWYHKVRRSSLAFWVREHQKDNAETEMWKQLRQKDQNLGRSGDRARKCSSDITLLMDEEAKIDLSS